MFEEIFQADLVVHDGLQTFDALVLDLVPLVVTAKKIASIRVR